ncbi:hypothetical protein EDC04DRAFT_2529685, partial [Pisolithus marmoratus]
IKFPLGFCTAVILGPKVAKDRLTQGMYLLNGHAQTCHGHSVTFFSLPWRHRNIYDAARKSDGDVTHPSDILRAMGETRVEIQNNAPYWAQQRRDHPFTA